MLSVTIRYSARGLLVSKPPGLIDLIHHPYAREERGP